MARWEVVTGNIVRCEVDAIVNAANSSLLGGGGVDGAIHRAAGPELIAGMPHPRRLQDRRRASITRGYRLPTEHIIHTVGPVWRGGANGEPELLACCYRARSSWRASTRCAAWLSRRSRPASLAIRCPRPRRWRRGRWRTHCGQLRTLLRRSCSSLRRCRHRDLFGSGRRPAHVAGLGTFPGAFLRPDRAHGKRRHSSCVVL